MTIETKFNLKDTVFIKELKKTGRVLAIYFSESGLQYSVRHFDNYTAHVNYFYEDELDVDQGKENLGFLAEKV